MEAHEPGHPDVSSVVLTPASVVRDVGSGEVLLADDWVFARMASEGREREGCLDELMNAIARGDVVVESEGAS